MRGIVALVIILLGGQLFGQEILTRPEAKIVQEALPGGQCPGCERWWNGRDPQDLRAKGWIVERVEVDGSRGKTYPRWRVCIGDECGFIEYTSEFKRALQLYLDRRQAKRGQL